MAMTSPGTSFDRVNRIALKFFPENQIAAPIPSTGQIALPDTHLAPQANRTVGLYEYRWNLSNSQRSDLFETTNVHNSMHGNGAQFSPFNIKKLGTFLVEPIFKARAFFAQSSYENKIYFGPINLESRFSAVLPNNSRAGTFVSATLKSLDESDHDSIQDRDVLNFGVFYTNASSNSYFESNFIYTPAGEKNSQGVIPYTNTDAHYLENQKFGAIYTATLHSGLVFKNFSFGGNTEIHVYNGYEHLYSSDYEGVIDYGSHNQRCTLITLGPEMK